MQARDPGAWALMLLMIAFASLSVATFFEGKMLWAVYNAIGAAFTAAFAVVVRLLRVPLPLRATAICYAAVCLHYVGGSIGGHFGVTGINGLYAAIPWYDRVTHFAGASGVALLVFHLLVSLSKTRSWIVSERALAAFAFCAAMTLGVFTELFEFAGWTFFGTIDQGFYSNTMMDLFTDLTGAAFGASISLALRSEVMGASANNAT